MSQETFLACDNPNCGSATRLDSDEADRWWSLYGTFNLNEHEDVEDEHTDIAIDACSIDCLVAAAGPMVLAAFLPGIETPHVDG